MLFALKIDVDTYRGMKEGLPRLLDILAARKILGTVFVSMGPDHSGRAIRRIFTKPGFLTKMLRTRAVALYGPKTVLYGTLLPGPRIAEGNPGIMRRIEAEGHEAGVHGWDHVRWQDGLPRFDQPTIARELDKAVQVFERIMGHRPRSTAAPGWIANERSLAVQDGLDLLYSSDVRGAWPFLPRAGGRTFETPQIPTTLPTLDEMIGAADAAVVSMTPDLAGGNPGFREGRTPTSSAEERSGTGVGGRATPPSEPHSRIPSGQAARKTAGDEEWINEDLVARSLQQAHANPDSPVVHTIHTEVEGLSRARLFEDLLDRLLAEGARFRRLMDVIPGRTRPYGQATRPSVSSQVHSTSGTHGEDHEGGRTLPICDVLEGELPGRSGTLAVQRVVD